MHQLIRTNLEQKTSREPGFTFVGNSSTGRFYSNWESNRQGQINHGQFLKWSLEIQFALVVLGLVQTGFVALGIFSNDETYLGWLTGLSVLIFQVASDALPRRRQSFWKLTGLVISLFPFLNSGSDNWTHFVLAPPISSIAFCLGVFWHIRRNNQRREGARRILPQMDIPSPFPQWPVTIKLYSGRILLGEDVGWLAFAEPFLHFQGRRTEFSLLGPDVSLKLKRFMLAGDSNQGSALSDSPGFQLNWKDGRNNQHLMLEPLYTSGENEHQILEEMGPILSQWQQLAKVPDLIGTFPPNFATPEIVARSRQRLARSQQWQKLIPFSTAFLMLGEYLFSKEATRLILLAIATVSLGVVLACFFAYLVREGLTELDRIPQGVLDSRCE